MLKMWPMKNDLCKITQNKSSRKAKYKVLSLYKYHMNHLRIIFTAGEVTARGKREKC